MAKQITDISGRGVGLDVVKSNIEALGGDVEVKSKLGVGTKFVVRLPLTLAIISGVDGGNPMKICNCVRRNSDYRGYSG